MGDGAAIHGAPRQPPRHQCRQFDRPLGGAPLCDGRRLPEGRRHRRATEGDAGCRARWHAGRRARPLGVARKGPFRSAGRADPGAVGRREGDLRARRRAARTEHRHDPGRRRPVCRVEGRHDAAPRRGDRPHRRLQQPVADHAPPGRVEDPHGAHRGDRGIGHPRLPDVQPEPGDAGLHDEEQPGLPRPADLAPDPADVERGEAAALRRPRNPRQAARRGGGQQARQRGRHLEDLVELHLGQRARPRKEQVDAVQVDRPDRRESRASG